MTPATVWAQLAAPIPAEAIEWRQDGRPVARRTGFAARFVPYINAQVVRRRLDDVVPGDWHLSLTVLPSHPDETDTTEREYSIKAALTVQGITRECIGSGADYKAAATDAFKRAAVRFGVASDLYDFDQLWVTVDSDSKFAKPLEDPSAAYARRAQNGGGAAASAPPAAATAAAPAGGSAPAPARRSVPVSTGEPVPPCPKCGGLMWDNSLTKRNPKAPDFKCRDKACDGAQWEKAKPDRSAAALVYDDFPAALRDVDDDLPF